MSLEDIVNVTITAQTTTPSRLGFGTPLIATVHTVFPDLVREYKKLSAMTDDGFVAADLAAIIATKVFSQNPKPNALKIGKRNLLYTQVMRVTPINTTEDYKYVFDVNETEVTYTNGAAETVATIVTALQALVTAISGVTATDDTTHMTVTTDTAGTLVDYSGFDEPDNFTLQNMTVDPGIATDLAAIEGADADGWYCLLLDSQGEEEIAAAAAWIEARKKIFVCDSMDHGILNVSVTDDVLSDLKLNNYARTALIYNMTNLLNFSAAGWSGQRLPSDPGSSTWAYKSLAGVTVDTKLTGAHLSAIEGKNGNHYTLVANIPITRYGITASGEFIDVIRFIDWLDARIKERIFGILINNEKIPYTDAGVDLMRGAVLAQLQQGIAAGGLAADPAPTVTAPLVADIDVADKANRILPDIEFQATLAGAIHKLVINGTLSV